GVTQPVAGALGMSEPRFVEIAGPAAEGTLVVNPFWPDNPDPRIKKWVDEYKRRASAPPSNTAALMYDSLHITKMCIEKGGVTNAPADLDRDRERIRDCWAGLKEYPGITGKITINTDGDAEL